MTSPAARRNARRAAIALAACHFSCGTIATFVQLDLVGKPSWSIPPSFVTVSIATGAGKEPYAARADGVRATWAPYFDSFAALSFDKNAPDWVIPIDPLDPNENYRGLALASIPWMLKQAPDAKWLVVADDDTLIVPHHLAEALAPLDPEQPILLGKCVLYLNVPFVVGGAGMVLSRRLAQDLAPHVRHCRNRYRNYPYGDAMIGACVKFTLYGQSGEEKTLLQRRPRFDIEHFGLTEVEKEVVRCLPGATNDDVELVDEQWVEKTKGERPVSLHIKDTGRFKQLWSSMQPSIDANRFVTWHDVLVARDAALAASSHDGKASVVSSLPKDDVEESKGLHYCSPVHGTAVQSWWEVCS